MGFVDRGGGREAKGSSLRRSKKNPGAPSSRNQCLHKNFILPPTRSTPLPPPACTTIISNMIAYARRQATCSSISAITSSSISVLAEHEEVPQTQTARTLDRASQLVDAVGSFNKSLNVSGIPQEDEVAMLIRMTGVDHGVLPIQRHIDASTAILSRKLQFDQAGLFRRAAEEGNVSTVLCWCAEQERQPMLVEMCKEHNKLLLSDTLQLHDRVSFKNKKGKKVSFSEDNRDTDQHKKNIDSGVDRRNSQKHAALTTPDGVVLYCLVGVHPNNTDSMKLKLQEKWVEEVRDYAKNAEVLGILSGLDLSRGSDSHYAQEWMLRQSWWVAGELKLPLVLFLDSKTSEGLIRTGQRVAVLLDELIQSSSFEANTVMCVGTSNRGPLAEDSACTASSYRAPVAVVLHNGLKVLACSEDMRKWVSRHQPESPQAVVLRHAEQKGTSTRIPILPAYVIVTVEGLNFASDGLYETEKDTTGDYVDVWAKLLPQLCATARGTCSSPAESTTIKQEDRLSWTQLLIGTASPWCTPQNLPDKDLCTLPNEPGHYLYVVRTLYEAMKREYEKEVRDTPSRADCTEISLVSHETLADLVLCNALWVFFADYIAEALLKDGQTDGCCSGHTPIDVNEHHVGPSSTRKKECPKGPFKGVGKVYVCTKCQSPLLDHPGYEIRQSSFENSSFGENQATQAKALELDDGNQVSHNVPLQLHVFPAISTDKNCSYNGGGHQFDALLLRGRLLYCCHCGTRVGGVNEGEEGDAPSGRTIQAHLTEVELVTCEHHTRDTSTEINSNYNPVEKEEEHVWYTSKAQCVIKRCENEEKDTDSFEALLEQATREREELERERAEAETHLDDSKASKKRKTGKKNVKANNKSNFTHFRNKDFTPRSVREKEREREPGKATQDNSHRDVRNDSAQYSLERDLHIEKTTTMLSSAASSHGETAFEEEQRIMRRDSLVKEEMSANNTGASSFIALSRRQRKKEKKHKQYQVKATGHNNDGSESDECGN
ncbi:unnamed protein product [Phytomonas sp. EM1]|nr:unnamed protein product [Phytomonas sp. EM1]|eukprot:CCW61453.1 unnamed protein product [Phytomonas sp. isolate EM1]